jgi:hypothetical protein
MREVCVVLRLIAGMSGSAELTVVKPIRYAEQAQYHGLQAVDTESPAKGIYKSRVRTSPVSPAGGDREVFGRGDSIPVPAHLVAANTSTSLKPLSRFPFGFGTDDDASSRVVVESTVETEVGRSRLSWSFDICEHTAVSGATIEMCRFVQTI